MICFISVFVCSNCFNNRFTSCTVVPLPAAMRFLREELMISGFSPEEVEQLHNLFARMIHNLTPTTDEGGINP